MTAARATFLAAFFLLPANAVAADLTPAAFQSWFQAAAQGKLDIPRGVERRAQEFRYVFVGGFANERMPGYFSQCARELKASGIAPGSIHFIFPSSHESFDGNRDEVRSRFLEIASQGNERLVVIAHSRGACDALAFALQNEEFVRDRVQALFLVQGAFGGTGAADYLMGEGMAIDNQMPLRLRALAYLLGKFEAYLLNRGKHGGLAGLTRTESERFWDELRASHASAAAVVGPKTYYVTSQILPARLRLFRRAIASYLQTYYGPNDGIVVLRDQSLAGLGTELGVLDAGHTDLTHRFPAGRASSRLGRALMQSIVMAVGRGEGDVSPAPLDSPRLKRGRAGRGARRP